jgi:hypothetical protein
MRIEPALLSYAGLACLAAWRAVHHFGPSQGPVAFIGMVSIAGLPLVLLLSRWPRAGLVMGVVASVMAFGSFLPGLAE